MPILLDHDRAEDDGNPIRGLVFVGLFWLTLALIVGLVWGIQTYVTGAK